MRCGCAVMIRLLRKDDDSWFISHFVGAHNHPLPAVREGSGSRTAG